MRFWLQLPQGGWVASRQNVRLYAVLAEELGFTGVWTGDHFVIPDGYDSQYPYGGRHPVAPDRPFLEAYTELAYVAGMTDRIRLAVTLAVTPLRHPVAHAKTVATLDHLSGGRLELGLGSGWLREEFETLQVPFRGRQAITDEYIEAMRLLWTGDSVSFAGKMVSFTDLHCLPRPAQRPHPPLWIGGSGQRAFERIAHFGAGWLAPDLPLAGYLDKLADAGAGAGDGGGLSRVFGKVWVTPRADGADDSLSIGVETSADLDVLRRMATAGTTDIRLDLSRHPSRQRPQLIHALAQVLRSEGWLDVR